ncbi:flagellar biosynthesis repressor FlbT [Paracoccus sp. APAP_BH8]|uniref:Flagellar biosynthesis repressor FlbT n=1 Tax=Paracoccus pantotrophus TaxID=82367 RepID=A0AAE6NR46_PARPN|nr:flagellar biosynthesis repressor FlbT [Paracoccus pantotrophus]MDF3856446.1 flagellar biosynthesis repressor FlbT [Paracoccus pantotrophus]QFG34956.1 flagellar biosynthesis repressor FlbT [Paracoccus pantotrophus]RNI16541.1 flagellar biosynthesis repressor FlbT [Paracoccus pantotrophus]
MTGLILKLAPGERVLVNGAIIENGDRRSRISILTPKANILRLRDAIHPESVDSPVSRICYICQLVLTGDAVEGEGRRQILYGIEKLSQVFCDPDSSNLLAFASNAIIEGNYYAAFRSLRSLIARESRLMAIGAP